MAFKQHVATLTGSAQRLTTAASITETAETRMAIWVTLQPNAANSNPIYIGDANVASDGSAHAFRLEAPAATIPPAPFVFDLGQLQMQLGDIYVKGTNTEKLHIGVIYG